MSKLQKITDRYGWLGLLRLPFYPFTALITTPIRLVQTLWACRVLADGRWGDYPHFTPYIAINSLFYWTAALNLYRFGRAGRSPYIGLGHYALSGYFHYSLPSLYAYWVSGAMTVLVGMFGWWLSHLVWLGEGKTLWVLVVMGLTLMSTTFYANTFGRQNYNVVGWMFFPLGLYGLATEQWGLAALAFLAASFGSFTVVFLGGILSLVIAGSEWTIGPIFAILPAGLKLLTHFWPCLVNGNMTATLHSVIKAIGVTKRNVKYKRTSHGGRWGTLHIYQLLIYSQFIILFWLFQREINLLVLVSVMIFLINSTCIRFADSQSISMLMLSTAQIAMVQNINVWLLLSYWILVSPLPVFAGFPSIRNIFDIVPRLAPFSIKSLMEGIEYFLDPARKKQRILMTFDNPEGVYEKIFDGYRALLELPLYAAAKKQVHFMPDWWGIFELNYEGAPEFWGRDVDSVLEKAKQWNADYVVVYQESGTILGPEWLNAGFVTQSQFSWQDYSVELEHMKLDGKIPCWWLLQVPV